MSKFRELLSGLLYLSSCALLILLSIFAFYTPEPEKKVLGLQSSVVQQQNLKTFRYNNEEIKYDSSIFDVIDKDEYMLILPESYDLFQYAKLGSFDNRTEYLENLKNSPIYKTDISQKEYLKGDGYEVLVFSFTQPGIIDRNRTLKLYLTVYLTDSNNYVEVRNFDFRTNRIIHKEFEKVVSQIEGKQTDVLGLTNQQTDLARVLGQASTVQIFSRNCYDVEFSNDLVGYQFSGKKYEVCSPSIGSGFMINDSGEILTNAHVIKADKFDSLVEGISTDGTYEEDVATDLVSMLYLLYGDFVYYMSEEELQAFYVFMIDEFYQDGSVTLSNWNNEIYVQFGNTFDIDLDSYDISNKNEHVSASIVRSNEISSAYQVLIDSMQAEDDLDELSLDEMTKTAIKEGLSSVSDIALIKLDQTKNIPSLSLSATKPMQGENIYVIGYPSIDDESLVTNNEVLASSIITTGSIIGIQRNTTDTYDLLQIDASVENGNSGGPILGSEGQVLGMTTYAYSSDTGNYNWGISSEELKKFLRLTNSNNEVNEEGLLLTDAMDDISKDYYSDAQEKLDQLVAGESSLNTTLTPIIDFCVTNIENGNDKSPWLKLDFLDFLKLPNWALIAIAVTILVIIITLIIIAIVKNLDKRNSNSMYSYAGPSPEKVLKNSNTNSDSEYIIIPPTPVKEDKRKDEYLVPQNNQIAQQPIQQNTPPLQNNQNTNYNQVNTVTNNSKEV
jgi:S1-C subfamily serine protease